MTGAQSHIVLLIIKKTCWVKESLSYNTPHIGICTGLVTLILSPAVL